MDRTELVVALRKAQVPEVFYDIPGVQDIRMKPDAYYFLRTDSGGWIVGLSDRGQDSVLGRFSNEDQACRDLYARLVTSRSAPPPDAAERVEDVLSRRKEIQRRAWDAFRRAPSKRTARRREEDSPPP